RSGFGTAIRDTSAKSATCLDGPPLVWVRCLSPHRGWLGDRCVLPENPTLGQGTSLSLLYPWDRRRPIPREAMISIKMLLRTLGGISVAGNGGVPPPPFVDRTEARKELGVSAGVDSRWLQAC